MTEARIWFLGDKAGKPRRKAAIARADLDINIVHNETRLKVVYDVPPRRHSLLVAWPVADIEQQKNIAQRLAQKSQLVTR